MQGDKENVIEWKSLEFALQIIAYCEQLEELKK